MANPHSRRRGVEAKRRGAGGVEADHDLATEGARRARRCRAAEDARTPRAPASGGADEARPVAASRAARALRAEAAEAAVERRRAGARGCRRSGGARRVERRGRGTESPPVSSLVSSRGEGDLGSRLRLGRSLDKRPATSESASAERWIELLTPARSRIASPLSASGWRRRRNSSCAVGATRRSRRRRQAEIRPLRRARRPRRIRSSTASARAGRSEADRTSAARRTRAEDFVETRRLASSQPAARRQEAPQAAIRGRRLRAARGEGRCSSCSRSAGTCGSPASATFSPAALVVAIKKTSRRRSRCTAGQRLRDRARRLRRFVERAGPSASRAAPSLEFLPLVSYRVRGTPAAATSRGVAARRALEHGGDALVLAAVRAPQGEPSAASAIDAARPADAPQASATRRRRAKAEPRSGALGIAPLLSAAARTAPAAARPPHRQGGRAPSPRRHRRRRCVAVADERALPPPHVDGAARPPRSTRRARASCQRRAPPTARVLVGRPQTADAEGRRRRRRRRLREPSDAAVGDASTWRRHRLDGASRR